MIALLALLLTSPSADPLGLAPVEEAFRMPGVTFSVGWQPCGEINAWYSPADRAVLLCDEIRALGAPAVRYFLAHELSHAVIDQRAIPYTGSQEAAADELASVVLGVYGWSQDVLAGAEFFAHMAELGEDPPFWDPHPAYAHRSATLVCLARESTGNYPLFCDPNEWGRALHSWTVLLKVD